MTQNLAAHNDGGSPRPLLLAQLSGFVETRLGLYFPAERLGDLERGIRTAASEFGFDSIDPCIDWLLSTTWSRDQIETLASHLTVGETYFFRDARIFEILESQLLPKLLGVRRERERNLRIWSAGCATGEEPYSLGMVLSRFFPELAGWNTTILATDIAPESLRKAREGIYGEWAFRGTPSWVREKYFTRRERSFQIDPALKRLVTFSPLNLVQDPYPAIINNTSGMDIIFCRNVLMYFSRERAARVIHDLARCLVDGGWLVISPVEAPGPDLTPLLAPVHFPGAILYRKGTRPAPPHPGLVTLPEPEILRKKNAVVRKTNSPARRRARDQALPPPQPPPDHTGQGPEQVRHLAGQGRLSDALSLCEEEILADKLNSSLHYLHATILQEMGRTTEAAAALRRAIYIDQDFVVGHFALGHLLQRQGKTRKAGKHFAKACTLLGSYRDEDVLPEAEGLRPARMIELINMLRTDREGR